MVSIKGKNVLITGASSGIGKALAFEIAEKGGIPILVARSLSVLEELEREIFLTFHIQSHIYSCDLQNNEEIEELFRELERDCPPHIIINNAGMGTFALFNEQQFSETEKMIRLNVTALMNVTYQAIPLLEKQQGCAIVNIASVAGYIATPKSSVYSATKHAVLGFTNALRLELKEKGIFVGAVSTGPVQTNFHSLADPTGNYAKKVEAYMLQPEEVAEATISLILNEKREVMLPKWMKIGTKLYAVSPSLFEKVAGPFLFKK